MEQISNSEAQSKVWDMIKDIRVALLVTRDQSDQLHARPMVAANKDFLGELWFFTYASSPKVAEIEHDPEVLLSYSEPKDQNYVSLRGKASVSHDRAKINDLWNEHLKTWFPKGKEDPNIALIRVDIEGAEYWDSPSSTFVYLYGYVKASLTGKPPEPGDNRKVDF